LEVHDVEAEPIFADDAIDALVTRSPDRLPSLLSGAAIPHGEQQFYNELLEEV
jgi:hypothetical protein